MLGAFTGPGFHGLSFCSLKFSRMFEMLFKVVSRFSQMFSDLCLSSDVY